MDFKKSLNAGLNAAKNARANKDEINSVLNELSDEINDFSNGLITLEVTRERKKIENDSMLSSARTVLGGLPNFNSFKSYDALSLIRNSNGQVTKKKLAEWILNDSDGYPCVISYSKQDVRCATKDTLIKALNDLMSDSQTGESLLELMEMRD